jgi:hypothetical protein
MTCMHDYGEHDDEHPRAHADDCARASGKHARTSAENKNKQKWSSWRACMMMMASIIGHPSAHDDDGERASCIMSRTDEFAN